MSKAESYLTNSLAEAPDDQLALHQLAVVKIYLQQHEEAAKLLERLLELNPQHPDALYLMSNIPTEAGQDSSANGC